MKMTTKSSTAMMSSVTRYYCCMRNYVIVIIEIISRICEKAYCVQNLTMLHILCGNCYFFMLLPNNSFNIYNYQVKLLLLHVVAYICYNCYFCVVKK